MDDIIHVVSSPSGPIFFFRDGTVAYYGPSISDDDDEDEDIGQVDETFLDAVIEGVEDPKVPVLCLAKSPTPPEFASGIRIGPFDENHVVEILGDPEDVKKFPKPYLFNPMSHDSILTSYLWITNKTKEALNRIYRELFGLLRLLVLIPYNSANEFVRLFVQSILVHIDSRIHTLTHRFLIVQPVYLHQTSLHLMTVCVNQIIHGIKPGKWENNYREHLNSSYDFKILPNEDNPFLMFCRQYYSEVIFGESFHEWVLAVHQKYQESIEEINADDTKVHVVNFLRRRAREHQTITGREGPFALDGICAVPFPDFPPRV